MAILSNFQANGQEAIKVAPPSQSGTLTYNGSAQSPTWTEYPTTVITVTSTAQTNAGTYNAVATLTSGYVWSDTLKGGQRNIPWTIGPATGGTIVLSKSAVELEEEGSDTVTATITGAGDTVTAVSSDTDVATVSVSGTTITITDGGTEGTATITVSASGNYSYASSATIMVEVSYGPEIVTWASGTNEQLAAMVDAHYAGKINIYDYWNIGDERNVTLSAIADGTIANSSPATTTTYVLVNKGGKLINSTQEECAFVVGTKGLVYQSGRMYVSSTSSPNWSGSSLRSWCNSNYYQAIPSSFRALLKLFDNTSVNKSEGAISTVQDYVSLNSYKEILGRASYYQEPDPYFDYYALSSNNYKKGSNYWTRTPYPNYDVIGFYYIATTSSYVGYDACTSYRQFAIFFVI